MIEQIHGGDVYRHPGVLDFSSNVNPLGTPRAVMDAAAESLKQIGHYPDVFCEKLRTALAEYEGQPAERIVCGNGAAELIFSLVLALRPGHAVLPAPTFAEYGQALKAVSCEMIRFPMRDFQMSEEILALLTDETDILFLCNPNNPTGFLTEPGLMRRILEHCAVHGIFLVIDECFLDFVDGSEAYTMKGALDTHDNLFLLKAFTKRYAMAGIRLGYGLCRNPVVLDRMASVTQPWNVSVPAQAAGIAALRETAYVERAQEIVREQREYLKREMRGIGLTVYDSRANYLFLAGPVDLYDRCLEKGILIRDCGNYPGLSKGYYRVAVRRPEENARLLEALRSILQTG